MVPFRQDAAELPAAALQERQDGEVEAEPYGQPTIIAQARPTTPIGISPRARFLWRGPMGKIWLSPDRNQGWFGLMMPTRAN